MDKTNEILPFLKIPPDSTLNCTTNKKQIVVDDNLPWMPSITNVSYGDTHIFTIHWARLDSRHQLLQRNRFVAEQVALT